MKISFERSSILQTFDTSVKVTLMVNDLVGVVVPMALCPKLKDKS